MSLFLAIFIIFHLLHSTKGQTDDDFFKICPPKKCGDEGPLIRFPFRLDSQPRSCTSVGAILILFSILVVIIYITKRSEKEKELRLKIEAFLAGYNTTKLTRYTLTDLKKITKKDPTVENASEVYFPEWAYDKLARGEDLEEVVEVGGNDEETAKKLVIVALWCVQCNPADRPCMSRVINMLEGDLQSLSMPPNPFA
ncbi:putative receptor-like protein kinase [Acorus gramineus]|uniref:Receptor-like protein kinase n=1 Tax=Acorus gramineus TaxID=55184 RepID=A0AAV9BSS6_ACOGR|nr:putative receptor-like protein kinase [Acorus gramineus]